MFKGEIELIFVSNLSGLVPEFVDQVAEGEEGYPLERHVEENVDVCLLLVNIDIKRQNLSTSVLFWWLTVVEKFWI